jgi:TPR repeat protein
MRSALTRHLVIGIALLAWSLAWAGTGAGPAGSAAFGEGRAAFMAKDYAKAMRLLKPLAEGGDAKAQVTVGIMYDFGHGVAKDPAQAIDWYEKAALQGIPVVQHDLGVKYFRGVDIKQDYAKAVHWWRMAAEGGLADSQYNLGYLYSRGLGVGQDDKAAAAWYEKAAVQDHAQAQYSLAVLFAFGRGVEADYARAAEWFRKAADQGMPQAQYNLGVLMENGQGVAKDAIAAREWYQKAASQGLEPAIKKLAGTEQPSLQTEGPPAGTPQAAPAVAGRPIHREDWIATQDPSRFTLQISSGPDERAVLNLLHRLDAGTDVAYFKATADNEQARYTALYGVFVNYTDAKNALSRLPADVQKGNPWIRKFAVIQQHLRQ